MSILSGLKNTAISLYNYLTYDGKKDAVASHTVEEKTAPKPQKPSSVKSVATIPIVNPTSETQKSNNINVKGVGDELIVGGEQAKEVNSENKKQRTLKEIKTALPAALAKNGINRAELRLKLSAISGKQTTKEDFKELNPKLQEMMLGYTLEAVERCSKAQKEGKLKNVSLQDAIAMDIAMMYNFITHDDDGNEVDLKTMTPEQVSERRKAVDAKYHEQKKLREEKISKLPEAEKIKALKELDDELASHRKHMFQNLYKNMSFQSALELLLIVSVQDVGNAAQELMEYYPQEIREKIANTMQSFESFKAYINIAKGRDEDLGDEAAKAAFEKYHMIFGSYKTKDNLKSYMSDAKAFVNSRESGEYPEGVYKATAMGVGGAVYANHVMTSEEKNESLSTWVQDYNGYLTDTEMALAEQRANEYIEEYLEKHPEERETFYRANSVKEIVEKTLGREFKPDKKVLEAEKAKRAEAKKDGKTEVGQTEVKGSARETASHTSTTSTASRNASKGMSSPIKAEQSKAPAEEVAGVKKSPKKVAQELISGKIDKEQAKKDVGGTEHDFVVMCAENPTLKALYINDIMRYIRTEKKEDNLRAIITKAPELALEVLSNMRGNKSELAQEVVGKHEVNSCVSMLLQKEIKNEDVKRYIV